MDAAETPAEAPQEQSTWHRHRKRSGTRVKFIGLQRQQFFTANQSIHQQKYETLRQRESVVNKVSRLS